MRLWFKQYAAHSITWFNSDRVSPLLQKPQELPECEDRNERCKVLNIEMGDSDEIIVLSGNNAHRRRRSKDPEPSKL